MLDDTGEDRNLPMPRDKKAHVIAGFLVSALVTVVLGFIGKDYWVIAGAGAGVLAGIVKELADRFVNHSKFDPADLGHTALGAIAGSAGLWLVYQGLNAIVGSGLYLLK